MLQSAKRTLLASVSIVLAACGGGGDSGGGSGGGGGGGGGGNSGTLSLSTNTLVFNAPSTASSVLPQVVSATVSANVSGTLFIRIVVNGPAVSNVSAFTITSATTGQATVSPASPAALGMGQHTSTITVTACTTDISCTSGIIGSPQTINVSYNVGGLTVTPTSLNYTITDTSPDAAYRKTLTLSAAPSWSILGAIPNGFSVTPPSSSTSVANSTVSIELGRASADLWQSGLNYAFLTLQIPSGAQVQIPITVDIQRPQVRYAFPHVEPANTAGETILRGNYLTNVPIGSIRFADSTGPTGTPGTPATSFTVVSATEIRVQRPALPAGRYNVQFTDSANNLINRSTASLVVIAPPTMTSAVIPWPSSGNARRVQDLYYDNERQTIVAGIVPQTAGLEASSEIIWYSHGGSGWSTASVRAMPFLSGLAMEPTGDGWLATIRTQAGANNAIQRCMAAFGSCADYFVQSASLHRRTRLGMSNDGEMVILSVPQPIPDQGAGAVQRYSIPTGLLYGVNPPVTYVGVLGASEDGSRVVIGSTSAAFGQQPLHSLNTSNAQFTSSLFTRTARQIVLSRNGSRVVIDNADVYDASLARLGGLPATTVGAVFSRDSNVVYTFDASLVIRRFDVSAPAPGGGVFPEIGTAITPFGNPGPGSNGVDLKMVLSTDGSRLFLAGSLGIVVQALP